MTDLIYSIFGIDISFPFDDNGISKSLNNEGRSICFLLISISAYELFSKLVKKKMRMVSLN